MLNERFVTGKHYLSITDTTNGKNYYIGNQRIVNELVDLLNELYEDNEQSKLMISTLRNIILENGFEEYILK